MNKLVSPFKYQGKIKVNSSKSYAQRAFILSLLAKGESIIYNSDLSNDVKAIQNCICQFGAQITPIENGLKVIPPSKKSLESIHLNVQESGLALRLLSVVSILFSENITITGSGSLLNRSQKQLIQVLENLGLSVKHNDYKLPLKITGTITKTRITIDASDGSQVISGLLMTLPLLKNDTKIEIRNITSRPYIEMTLEIMEEFGVDLKQDFLENFLIVGNKNYKGSSYFVEGDWSGAANHCVGAAISGNIDLEGLNPNSKQADAKILEVIKQFGAKITFSNNLESHSQIISIAKSELNKPTDSDITDSPDLFPIIAILACASNGKSIIRGTNRLINKESNRLISISKLLSNFSIKYEIRENEISIWGNGKILVTDTIDTFNDHRIAMAAVIGATISDNAILLNDIECVNKSYPNFIIDLKSSIKLFF